MAGFGTYGNGGPYPYSSSSSSPSSLSALAPPFTVDRSVPKPISSPLVDLTEPPYVAPLNSSLHNWIPSHSSTTGSNFFANPTPDFNSMPSSNAYRYPGLQTVDPLNANLPPLNTIATTSSNAFAYDQSLDSAVTSFVEAKPYYPSYLSPTMHRDSPLVVPDQPTYDWISTTHFAPLDGSSHKDYSQRPSDSKYPAQWGGMWNGTTEWEQGKHGDFDGSFRSKKTDVSGSLVYKNFMNQEPHSSNSLNSSEEASQVVNILSWDNHGSSVSAEHLGDKSFVGKISKFAPADCPKSITGSLSVVPETHLKAPFSQFVTNTTNSPYVYSEKRQHDASVDDIMSISKSSPVFATIAPSLGIKSSEPEMVPFRRLNFRSDAADTSHGRVIPASVLEPHVPQILESKVCFNSSQFGVHLRTNEFFSVESRNEELSKNRTINMDAWDHVFKAKAGLQSSQVSPDSYVALNTNETVNSFLSSSENVDTNNPAVDSPCWKGVPGSRFSPFGAYEDGGPEKIKKPEDCNGLNVQMPPMFPLNAGESVSSQNPIKNPAEHHEFGWPDNGLTLPWKRYSVANSSFGEHKLDGTVKSTYNSETSHDTGPQSYRDVLHKSGNGDKSLSLFGHSHAMQPGDGEDGLAAEVKQTTWGCDTDVKLDVNDTMEYGSLLLPSHAENILCSPVEDAATMLSKSSGEESILKVDVQKLVNTMNSLSELLLINCSSSSGQLKKNDLEALKAVTNNLHICISKNVESPSFKQNISQHNRELSEDHQNVESPSFKQNISQHNRELSEHHRVLRSDGSLSASSPNIQDQVLGSVSVQSGIDMEKEDKMTQAIKEILSENFHAEETDPQALLYKNLWLEAEAVLCSINYKARFDRVKIEMDKCKADKSKGMMKQLRSEVSPDSNPINPLTSEAQGCRTSNLQGLPIFSQEDDVWARFNILRGRVENSTCVSSANVGESSTKVSPDPIAPEANGSPSPGISIQDSPASSTTGLKNDHVASVMARFRILRDQIENSKCINAVNVEEPSSFKVSPEPKTDVIASDTSDDSVPEFNIQDSPISITTSQVNDCEASVMSRHQILTSWIDNCGDMTEGQQLPDPNIDVITPEPSDSFMPEFNIQDSPISSTVMSRLHILKSRIDNCGDVSREGQQLPDPKPEPSDSLIPNFNIQDSPVLSTTSQENDCEGSVMSRLHILKSRADNCGYMHTEGQQLPIVGGLRYAGKRNPWPIIRKRSSEGGSSDFKEQPILQSYKADYSEGNLVTAKEFHLFGEDDPLTQYHKINRPVNQFPAGWHDTSSSSDWEHVMKEEVWEHNC